MLGGGVTVRGDDDNNHGRVTYKSRKLTRCLFCDGPKKKTCFPDHCDFLEFCLSIPFRVNIWISRAKRTYLTRDLPKKIPCSVLSETGFLCFSANNIPRQFSDFFQTKFLISGHSL